MTRENERKDWKWKVEIRPGKRTALRSRTAKNPGVSTGPLACSFAHSLASLIHSLAPHYSLFTRISLCSLVCWLAHSLTPEPVGRWMIRWLFFLCYLLFCTIVDRGKRPEKTWKGPIMGDRKWRWLRDPENRIRKEGSESVDQKWHWVIVMGFRK